MFRKTFTKLSDAWQPKSYLDKKVKKKKCHEVPIQGVSSLKYQPALYNFKVFKGSSSLPSHTSHQCQCMYQDLHGKILLKVKPINERHCKIEYPTIHQFKEQEQHLSFVYSYIQINQIVYVIYKVSTKKNTQEHGILNEKNMIYQL